MKLLVLASDPIREDDVVGEAESRFGVPVTEVTH